MRVLNLLTGGQIGGIETLCYNWGKYAEFENGFAFLTESGTVYEEMKKSGFTLYDLSVLGDKVSLKKLIRIIGIAKNYDFVVVHHGDPILRMYYIAISYFTSCRMVSYVHSCYADESQDSYRRIKKAIVQRIFQTAFDRSDAVISVSHAGEESYLKKYSVPQKKRHVVYNGISEEILKKGGKNTLLLEEPYHIAYIGRLHKVKGVDLLISAISVVKKSKNVVLDIIGDGQEMSSLGKLAQKLQINDCVNFHGKQMDVTQFLANTNVFVYPSTCEEVFGISIAEALAFGIPCIGNPVGGVPEVIHDGENGLLTDEISSEAIAKAIIKVIEAYETGKIQQYSKNAKESVIQFSINKNCKSIQKILSEL